MTAFLLTWKVSGWPHENIVRMVRKHEAQGYVDEPWRIMAHKMAKVGDRAWVLQQGRSPKGIFGVGRLTGAPTLGPTGAGKMQMFAPIRFDAFVDPMQKLLISEEAVASVLRTQQIQAQASGYPISDGQSAALEEILRTSSPLASGSSGDWTATELHAITTDYFAMLDDELAGQPYSKTEHRNALRTTVHRSPGSIERKHQNISAVLQELGLPWINGYKPLGNYQDALVDLIGVRLEQSIARLDQFSTPTTETSISMATVFVPPPPPTHRAAVRPIARIAMKFDPAKRDAANRSLGRAGEDYVFRLERSRLEALGLSALASKVTWVSDKLGDGLGYDIESYSEDGNPMFIEVKTTNGPITTPFFVSENERRVAADKGQAFRIYRLFGFSTDPKIYSLPGPLERTLTLDPIAYRARP